MTFICKFEKKNLYLIQTDALWDIIIKLQTSSKINDATQQGYTSNRHNSLLSSDLIMKSLFKHLLHLEATINTFPSPRKISLLQ